GARRHRMPTSAGGAHRERPPAPADAPPLRRHRRERVSVDGAPARPRPASADPSHRHRGAARRDAARLARWRHGARHPPERDRLVPAAHRLRRREVDGDQGLMLIVFDVDGTLVRTVELDAALYVRAFAEVVGQPLPSLDWSTYRRVTD